MWDRQPVAPDDREDLAYDPFGKDPLGHICTTYNIENARPGECPAHEEGWRFKPHYCHEHREWHTGGDAHDECEACEWERNHPGEYLDEEQTKEKFETGAVCDGHLWEEEDEAEVVELSGDDARWDKTNEELEELG